MAAASIYLDNAASTPPYEELAAEMPKLAGHFANPGAAHATATRLRRRLDAAADEWLETLGADPNTTDVVWTSGGTEANNLAILGTRPAAGADARVISATEHPSVDAPCHALAKRGARITSVPVDGRGALDADALAEALTPETALVSICMVQNETGAVQDLNAIRRLIDEHAPRALLHLDAVQAVGKLPIPWRAARPDLVAIAGHKLHGPSGVGCLVVRRGVPLQPLILGGGQQRGLRSGSLDAPGILAFTRAGHRACTEQQPLYATALGLRGRLRQGLGDLTGRDGDPLAVRWLSPPDGSPFICTFALPGYQGAILARALGERGICVGTGSACASESRLPSRILTAMGVPKEVAFGAIRVSFGYHNTATDIDGLLQALQHVLAEY